MINILHAYRSVISGRWRRTGEGPFDSVQRIAVAVRFIGPFSLFIGHEADPEEAVAVIKPFRSVNFIPMLKGARKLDSRKRIAFRGSLEGELEDVPFFHFLLCGEGEGG